MTDERDFLEQFYPDEDTASLRNCFDEIQAQEKARQRREAAVSQQLRRGAVHTMA